VEGLHICFKTGNSCDVGREAEVSVASRQCVRAGKMKGAIDAFLSPGTQLSVTIVKYFFVLDLATSIPEFSVAREGDF
jgi:uncharacterized protein (DUF2237 family)